MEVDWATPMPRWSLEHVDFGRSPASGHLPHVSEIMRVVVLGVLGTREGDSARPGWRRRRPLPWLTLPQMKSEHCIPQASLASPRLLSSSQAQGPDGLSSPSYEVPCYQSAFLTPQGLIWGGERTTHRVGVSYVSTHLGSPSLYIRSNKCVCVHV